MSKKNILKLLIAIFISINIFAFVPEIFSNNNNINNISSRFDTTNTHAKSEYTFGIKKAHAEHMIIQGLEQGGSGSTWVFDIWNFSISLVNIVLIGILIFLGVVNILHLNYDTYQLKKFLVPLIIGVLLANFSLFICRAIVDLSSALSGTFFENQEQLTSGIMNGLGFTNAGNLIDLLRTVGGSGLATGLAIPVMVVYTILGIILGLILVILFLAITVLLYVRVFVVLILAAIAPLAFISMVIPSTQQYFKQWWGWFLKWVFMGPIITLILKVAAIIGNSVGASGTSTSTAGAMTLTLVFSFIAILGLLILALMVPFMLGGQIMSKVAAGVGKTAGFAGKYVPGVKHVAQMGKGYFGDMKKNQEESEQDLQAYGAGLFKGGKAGADAEQNIIENERAAKKAGQLVQLGEAGEHIDAARLKAFSNGDSKIIQQYAIQRAREGDLDNETMHEIDQLVVSGDIKFKDQKEAHKFRDSMDNALSKQRKQLIKDKQNPMDVNNPLHAYDFDKKGKPIVPANETQKEASAKLGNAISNIDMYDDIRKSTNIRPHVKQAQAQKAMENIDHVLSNKDKIKDKDTIKRAERAFNNIEQDVNTDPSLRSFTNNQAFRAMSEKYGVHKHVNKFIGNDESLNKIKDTQEAAHVREFLSRPIQVEDIDGQPRKEEIRKVVHGHEAIKRAMISKNYNPEERDDVNKYFASNADHDNTKLKENYLENRDIINKHQDYAKQIKEEMQPIPDEIKNPTTP